MPKIIENVEERIYDAALQLFGEKGYDKVEMKMIAKEAEIAVGTLYNYYPNKKNLFICIFNKSWQETFRKLDIVLKGEEPIQSKIRSYLATLYDDVLNRNGLGRQLFLLDEKGIIQDSDNGLIDIRTSMVDSCRNVLNELKDKEGIVMEPEDDARFIETLFVTTFMLLKEHQDEKEANLKFLNKLIDAFIS